jgi:hypothetical protein
VSLYVCSGQEACNPVHDPAVPEKDQRRCTVDLVLCRDQAVDGYIHAAELYPPGVFDDQFFQNRRQSLAVTSARREKFHEHCAGKFEHLIPEIPVVNGD